MTKEEFFGAKVVCPYCDPSKPRTERQIAAIDFESHRDVEHMGPSPCGTFALAFASRDADLVLAACQRAFERSIALGDTVLVRWEESGCRLEARGTVMVLGAGFFRVHASDTTDWVRVPEYGCPGWSLTNCIRPAWEGTP